MTPAANSNTHVSLLHSNSFSSPQETIFTRDRVLPSASSSPSDEDLEFWRRSLASPLLEILRQTQYSTEAIDAFKNLIDTLVLPALGRAPQRTGQGWNFAFPSFMNDNHCPVEIGLTWEKGQPSVKFSIEPIGCPSGDEFQTLANLLAAERLCQALSAAGLGNFDRLRDLAKHCICEEYDGDLLQGSQVFVAFDLKRSGKIFAKAYLMPHARAKRTSASNFEVVDEAIRRVHADGTAWSKVCSYYHSLCPSERPEPVVLSTDCSDDASARIKIYFRYRTKDFESVLQHLSLGGRISAGWDRSLRQLWDAVLSEQKQDETTCLRTISDDSEATGGVLIYYDFSESEDEATAKIYLPVRHWAASDQAAAEGLSQYLQMSQSFLPTHFGTSSTHDNVSQPFLYERVLQQFAQPFDLQGRGLQNYVCIGQKKDGRVDLSVYLNPLPPQMSGISTPEAMGTCSQSAPCQVKSPEDEEDSKTSADGLTCYGSTIKDFLRRTPRVL
ncbi:hypothetical protein CF326_g3655 [Tilletia indica]|nr:hypothetical protein CF326_g3655 [Tilletia indica]